MRDSQSLIHSKVKVMLEEALATVVYNSRPTHPIRVGARATFEDV